MAINVDEIQWDDAPQAVQIAPEEVQWDDAPKAPAKKRTMTENLVRQLGLTARAGVTGVTGLSSMLADLPVQGANLLGAKLPLPSQAQQQMMTKLGLPEPEGTGENVVQALSSMVAGGFDPVSGALQAATKAKVPEGFGAQQATTRAETIKEVTKAGVKLPPSVAGAGVGSRTLEGFGGTGRTEALMRWQNKDVFNRLATKALKLPDDTPLSPQILDDLATATYKEGYLPITQAGNITTGRIYRESLDDVMKNLQGAAKSFPKAEKNDVKTLVDAYRVRQFDADDAIKATRQLRLDAKDAYSSGNNALGKAQRSIAEAIEDNIELNLKARGKDGAALLQQFKDARVHLSKIHAINDALVPGTGDIDALNIAAQASRGTKFTEELATIAKAGSPTFSKATRYPKEGLPPLFNPGDATMLGFGGSAAFLNPGMGLLAVIPTARAGARQLVSTTPFQKAFVQGTGQAPGPGIFGNPITQRAIPSLYPLFGQGEQ